MAARREAAERRRRRQTWIAGGVAGALVLGAVIWIITAAVGGDESQPVANAECVYTTDTVLPSADPSADPTATDGATADPTASPTPAATLPEGVKDIGRPVSNPPRTGYQIMTFETNLGRIEVEMDLSKTPCTANSMNFLANNGFYDGTSCHRLVQDIFALQCGDPSGTGMGGANYSYDDENLPTGKLPAYHEGDVAMANTGLPGSNGTQFFFVYGLSSLPGNYSLWGRVISGMDIIRQVAAGGDNGEYVDAGGGRPNTPLTFTKVTVGPVSETPAPTPEASASTSPDASPTTT